MDTDLTIYYLDMRMHEQYWWNILFTVLFVSLVLDAIYILDVVGYRTYHDLTVFDFAILSLAAFRLTRLIVYDKITAFFREQFWNEVDTLSGKQLEKPKSGPRRTLAELLSCPWCFGLWASAMVVFFYLLTPLAQFPIFFLAVAGIASPLQLISSLIGHKVDIVKRDTGTSS